MNPDLENTIFYKIVQCIFSRGINGHWKHFGATLTSKGSTTRLSGRRSRIWWSKRSSQPRDPWQACSSRMLVAGLCFKTLNISLQLNINYSAPVHFSKCIIFTINYCQLSRVKRVKYNLFLLNFCFVGYFIHIKYFAFFNLDIL